MILVAIGANLPGVGGQPPIETCRAAALALDRLQGLRLVGLSRWYRTRPEPQSDQPDYVNGVAHLSGNTDPATLLGALLRIEAAAGRERTVANAARSLDLDIIAMDALVRDRPDPVLPHPRAHQRGFVLLPLRDVAPRWVHPRLGRSVEALIAELSPAAGG